MKKLISSSREQRIYHICQPALWLTHPSCKALVWPPLVASGTSQFLFSSSVIFFSLILNLEVGCEW